MATATSELLPEVSAFLDCDLQRPLVGGKETAASGEDAFETHDPGSGETLATVPNFPRRDVDAAVAAAQQAFDKSGWATLPPNERGALLHRLADEVERRIPIIAPDRSSRCGQDRSASAQGDVANFVATMRYFADMAQHINRRNRAGRERPRSLDDAASVGAVRFYLPVELSVPAHRLGNCAGAGGRQHGRHQAGRGHAAVGHLFEPPRERSRLAGWRDQRRHRHSAKRPGPPYRGTPACGG